MMTVEQVREESVEEAMRFLLRREDYALFLLGNLERQGTVLTEAPNSGNFKWIRSGSEIVALFCLTRRGNLLIQSDKAMSALFEKVVEECRREPISIGGLLGEWGLCKAFWQFLKEQRVIAKEVAVHKEVLYQMATVKGERQSGVRLLAQSDYERWATLSLDYLQEENIPSDLSDREMRALFKEKIEDRSVWGTFCEGELAAIGELNAKGLDLGQVGGVYTAPRFRRKGLARALMRQIVCDAQEVHKLRKLIIFTGEQNRAARELYESLGALQVGHYALLFGDPSS